VRACKYKRKISQYLIFYAPIYYVTTNKHHQNCQLSSQSAVNFNHCFPTKYPQMLLNFTTTKPMLGFIYLPKIRPSQLSRRIKDYLPQETASHSLLRRYRSPLSSHFILPRTQSLRFADTSERTSVHSLTESQLSRRRRRIILIWVGPIFLYSRASIAHWLTFGAIALACPNMVSKCSVRLDISRV